jgi:hypothetical protein
MRHAIISHDVDHLRSSEHWRDLLLPKQALRAWIELAAGTIPLAEVWRRQSAMLGGQLEHIEELLDFDNRNGIRPTFFFGVNRGLGLSYSLRAAEAWLTRLRSRNCELGIHGIAYDDMERMTQERDRFANLSGLNHFGIRMHYLRQDAKTLDRLGSLEYLFDTTGQEKRGPWRHSSGMWVFPLHVMDGWHLMAGKRWQIRSAREAFTDTRICIEALWESGVDYLTINFHDSYFTTAFASWKEWYERVVAFLQEQDVRFVTYSESIHDLSAIGGYAT